MTALPKNSPPEISREIDLLTYAKMMQRITRVWCAHLSAHEITVLMQIADRTLGWGVSRARFCTRSLRCGDKVYSGVEDAVSRRSLFNCLKSLEDKGMILRHSDDGLMGMKMYSINLGWVPDMLNSPKRLKLPVQEMHHPVHELHSGSAPPAPLEDSPIKIILEDNLLGQTASQPPSEKIEEVIRTTKENYRAPVADKVTDCKPCAERTKASIGEIETVWRAAMRETFPSASVPAWSMKQKHIVLTTSKAWQRAESKTFIDLLDWSVRNYTQIVSKYFSWMRDNPPPAVPDIGFVVAMRDHFMKAFDSKALDKWMSRAERSEFERMLGRGMTREQALKEMGRKEVTSRFREEIDRREAAARVRDRVATVKLERAEKLMDYAHRHAGKGIPVHPRAGEFDFEKPTGNVSVSDIPEVIEIDPSVMLPKFEDLENG